MEEIMADFNTIKDLPIPFLSPPTTIHFFNFLSIKSSQTPYITQNVHFHTTPYLASHDFLTNFGFTQKITRARREEMDIELAKCECCGLKEDCTQDYINEVKSKFEGKWLCGLCSEAVRDEVSKGPNNSSNNSFGVEEAMKAHMSFCRKYKSNPAIRVADGMRQMLRRRSNMSSASSKKYSRSTSTSQVGDDCSFSYY